MSVNFRRMFIRYDIPYKVEKVREPNFKGTIVDKKRIHITKDMIATLIERMSANNFIDNRGHSHERRKKPCIEKLREFSKNL